MKRILKHIIILMVSLIVLAAIIYIGQYATKLRFKNTTWLRSLTNENQLSFDDLSKSFQIGTEEQHWPALISLIPKLRTDIELQNNLAKLRDTVTIFENGTLASNIITGADNALTPLKNLDDALKFLENYNLESINKLHYQTSNWLSFFGYESPKNYFVMFQESNISRPAGGFLNNYAILGFNQGKMTVAGDTILDLDDLLLTKIVPPLPLQSVSNTWFFHDVNWFFDFPTTGKKVLEFYRLTNLKPELDGVIAVNNSVMESILGITGGIQLKDYNLTIDAQNFSSALFTNDNRDIFSAFIEQLGGQLKNLSLTQFSQLQNIIINALTTKDIQLYSTNDEREYFFDSYGWAGKLTEGYNDYVAVNFNNLDKNFKTDKREQQISLETKMSTSSIINILTVRSPALRAEDINKETYLKIYFPKGIAIINASGGYLKDIKNGWPYETLGYQIDDDISNIENRRVTDSTNSIDIFEESSKTVIGTWAKLSARPFILTYRLPIETRDIGNWNLIIQKQSGQRINFSYNLIPLPDKTIAPTLFEFKKLIPLGQDLNLDFKIEPR